VLPAIRALGSLDLLATVQNNLAGVSAGLGDPDSALAWLHATLPLRERIGQPKGIGEVHNNLAFVYRRVGEIQRALDEYTAAIPWRRGANDTRGLGVTYNNIGFLFQVIGDPARAQAWLRAALPISRAAQDRANEARIELNLGNAARSLGLPDESIAHHERALEISRALSDAIGTCRALTLLATDHRERGAIAEATKATEDARDCESIPDMRARAWFALERGRLLAYDDPVRSRAELEGALALFEQQRDPVGTAAVHGALSDVAMRGGDATGALEEAHAAIAALESLRISIAATDQLARFTSVQQSTYDRAIALHLARHDAAPGAGDELRALELVAATRARTLAERLQAAESRPEGAQDDPGRARYREERRRTSDLANSYFGHLEKGELQEAEKAAVEYDLARTRLASLERKLFGPQHATLSARDTLPALQARLDTGLLVLVYWLGEDAGRLWAVSRESVESRALPKRAEIETLARRVYAALRRSQPAAAADAGDRERLSEMLLGGIAGLERYPDLYVSADGVLNYLPFAALAPPSATAGDGASALVDGHRVASLPALALPVRGASAADAADGTAIVVFADPVYAPTDERFAPGAAGDAAADDTPGATLWLELTQLPRLHWSRAEVEAIADDATPGRSRLYADFDATRERLLALDGDARILHVSAHVRVDSRSNATSGVVLSLFDAAGDPQPGFVSYYDLLHIRRSPPLVVLSGCDTGLGVDLHGEGPVGLARAFMYSGATEVVSSLWPAGDQSSARLMAAFYRGLLDQQLSPAAALQQAQLELRSSGRRFRHPHAWAAFTVSYRSPDANAGATAYARAAGPAEASAR
jgi:tetratricopeptide (TPR) repeat protein